MQLYIRITPDTSVTYTPRPDGTVEVSVNGDSEIVSASDALEDIITTIAPHDLIEHNAWGFNMTVLATLDA
jgi:hypothetical protein